MNQANQTNQTIFSKFVWVNPDISLYGGQISLGKTSLKTKDIPKDLISEGGLKLVAPSTFNPLQKHRTQVRTLLLESGQSFLGGYAIPVDKWKDIERSLNDIKTSFQKSVQTFADSWALNVQEWAEKENHQQHRDIIIASAPSSEVIKTRFSFEYSAAHFSPLQGSEAALEGQVKGLYSDIYKDIAKKAENAIRSYEADKSQISRKMRSTINSIVEKLKCLSFVSPKLAVTAKVISDYFEAVPMPDKGNLPKETQSRIAILLVAMKNPENLPDLATVLTAQQDKVSSLRNLTQPAKEQKCDESPMKNKPSEALKDETTSENMCEFEEDIPFNDADQSDNHQTLEADDSTPPSVVLF